jgi:pyruvate/2-oxoglutarate dehydrogenase complex dihydrolipoamide acyltransferase (E2) component
VSYEFKLPDLGEGLTEGEIARWLVEEGQEIAEDAPLVEIATDKTTVEIPSPAAGLVSRILVPEGDVVPVGTVLVVIGGDDSDGHVPVPGTETRPERTSTPAPGRATAKVRATPLIRKVAQELGVDLAAVEGTGPAGRITEEDVKVAAASSGHVQVSDTETGPEGTRVELHGIKRQMFEHLTRAHEIPAVTWVEECDFSGVERTQLVPLVVHAVVESLREFPELNGHVENGELVLLDRYDIGVAMQTEQGLVVPVVHRADELSVDELDAELKRLAEAAHEGSLKPEELRRGTFTVTSAGKVAGLFVTPLINHPEVAILGIHRIADRPVVRDGEVVVRQMGNVSVTFDHRVIDGKRAADFGLAVIARLQS